MEKENYIFSVEKQKEALLLRLNFFANLANTNIIIFFGLNVYEELDRLRKNSYFFFKKRSLNGK